MGGIEEEGVSKRPSLFLACAIDCMVASFIELENDGGEFLVRGVS